MNNVMSEISSYKVNSDGWNVCTVKWALLHTMAYSHNLQNIRSLSHIPQYIHRFSNCEEGRVCNESQTASWKLLLLSFSVMQPHGVTSQCGVTCIVGLPTFYTQHWKTGSGLRTSRDNVTYRKSSEQISFSCITFTDDKHFQEIMILCPAYREILINY